MAIEQLTLATLGDLDGGAVGAMIDRELALAAADLDDRGKDGKARKVTITVELKQANNGQVVIDAEARHSLPPLRSASTFGELRRTTAGTTALCFQAHNPENPEQPTLDEYERRERQG